MSSNKIEINEIFTLVQSNGALRIAYSIYLFSKLSLRHVFDNKQAHLMDLKEPQQMHAFIQKQ